MAQNFRETLAFTPGTLRTPSLPICTLRAEVTQRTKIIYSVRCTPATAGLLSRHWLATDVWGGGEIITNCSNTTNLSAR